MFFYQHFSPSAEKSGRTRTSARCGFYPPSPRKMLPLSLGPDLPHAASLHFKHLVQHSVVKNQVFKIMKQSLGFQTSSCGPRDDLNTENVIGFGDILPKGEYTLNADILSKEEEELSAKSGDKVIAYEDSPPVDTILGIEIFPVIHVKTQEKIYVSLEDLDQ